MHLSIFSDCFISDSLADATTTRWEADRSGSHLVGLLRGLVFVAALLLPFIVSAGCAWLRADAGDLVAPAAIAAVPASSLAHM